MQDAVVEVLAPAGGQFGPVLTGRDAVVGQCGEGLADACQWDAQALRHPDERDAPQRLAGVAALIAAGAAGMNEALALIEVQGRNGHSAAVRHLARREFVDQLHELNNS